jgi:hypothetical protein
MGRIAREGQSGKLPEAILVEPVQIGCPGAYIASVVSDVFVRDGDGFMVHRNKENMGTGIASYEHEPQSREKVKGDDTNPVEIRVGEPRQYIRTVTDRESGYCMLELINTSSEVIEIGKNVELGEGEPLELRPDEAAEHCLRNQFKHRR